MPCTECPPRRGIGPRWALDAAGDVDAAARLCVGDGAVRYREVLEANGGPPDDDARHARAAFHARLATSFGPVDAIEPI